VGDWASRVRLLARWTSRWRVMPFQVPWRETPSEVAPRQKRVDSFEEKGGSGCVVSLGSYLILSM